MRAEIEKFFNETIKESVSEHICTVITSLCEELIALKDEKNANDRIQTEMAIQYTELLEKYTALNNECNEIKEQLARELEKNAIKNKAIFGSHTEKLLRLIDASINKSEEIEDESETESVEDFEKSERKIINFQNHKNAGASKNGNVDKKCRRRKLRESLDNLPQEYEYLLEPEKLNELYGAGNWRIGGWHLHRSIEKIQLSYYTKNIFTPVISSGLEHKFETIPYCNPLIDKSYVSASFIADILYRKFCLSLPFYRQAIDYSNQGIEIPRQDITRWVNRCVPVVLKPVYDYMLICLIKLGYIQSDESIIKVNHDERSSNSNNYMWVHCSSEMLDCNPIVIFSYEATRNTDHLRNLFGEFLGYITCDAYVSYQVFEAENEGIKVSGCLMHARRYFAIALFLNDVANMSDEEIRELPETKALMLIRDIYAKETPLKSLNAQERLEKRQIEVKPAVDSFFEYIHELNCSEEELSERLNKAVTYAINQETYLRRFLDDGNIPCDNGHSERCIRSYSVGRANWLFADTVTGAEVNAIAYSITETAKANEANAEIYLKYLFEQVSGKQNLSNECLEKLMPWAKDYQEYEADQRKRNLDRYKILFPMPEAPRTPRKNKKIISIETENTPSPPRCRSEAI